MKVHLKANGRALCGRAKIKYGTYARETANCEHCLKVTIDSLMRRIQEKSKVKGTIGQRLRAAGYET